MGSVPLLITEILADMTKEETKAEGSLSYQNSAKNDQK